MNYTVYTAARVVPFTVDAVSPQDAALKVATRMASRSIIPHVKPHTFAVIATAVVWPQEIDRAKYIADYTRVEVTPLGRTLGSIRALDQAEVAA